MSSRGFSVVEMLVVVTLGAIIVAAAIPAFLGTMKRMEHTSAVRQLLTDVRGARSKAIATGWEYRLVGYDTDEIGERRNSYRILARLAPTAWPAEDSAAFESDDALATPWMDLKATHPGVTFDSTNPRFVLTFDARGTAPGAAASFNPLRLIGSDGDVASLTVSTVGGIKVQ